jgi:NADH:ubiquinone oxidoreductase subunit 2 (subunit N)
MISTKADLEIIQEDSLFFRLFFFYSVCTIAIFFFGVADRYFLSKIGQLEFPILVLFIHFGGLFAMRMHTFMDLLIALEIVTLASYVLVTFERTNRFSTYAGVQYFILGSLPSARLLLAFSLFYLQSGSRAFQDLDLFFNSVDSINYTSDNVSLKDFYIETPYIEMSPNISFAELIINYASVDSSFFSDQLESIVLSINPVNSRSVMALLILFFNFFFKITVAPVHV